MPIARRRLLQLAGAGIIGGSLAVGRVAAVDPDHPNTIVFDGSNTTGESSYEFGVSDSVVAHGDVGALEVDDTIDGTTVIGTVQDDVDAYRFAGTLTHLAVDGEVDVSITYEEVSSSGPDRLEILTPADGSVDYTFDCSGEIQKVLDNGDNSSEGNDTVTQNSDGTWTATGLTGNGYGDSYDLYGDVTTFDATGEYTLFLNGTEVTVTELTGQTTTDDGSSDGDTQTTHRLEILTPPDGSIEYTMTTSGEITKVTDVGDASAEGNDTVTQNSDGTWTVTGLTGNGYGDTLDFVGEALAFDPLEGTFTLYLDGQEVTAYELIGEEPPSDDDSGGSSVAIGGGDGYANTVDPSAATVTVSSYANLVDALSTATSGDVVYIDGSATIDMGGNSFDIPSGVTLASDRGINGSNGGVIQTADPGDWHHYIYAEDGARFTGIEFRGPYPDSTGEGSGLDGIRAVSGSIEVDNCELYGFSEGAVRFADGDGTVHHNYIHHNDTPGYGYGNSMDAGRPVIEYNYFNYNRHSTESSGDHGGYVARYNHFGPDARHHVIDAHDPDGDDRTYGDYHVHNNVVEAVEALPDAPRDSVVAIGGFDFAEDSFVVEDNWFFHDSADAAFAWDTSTGTVRNNHFGEGAAVSYGDVIPGYDGWRSP